MTLNEASTQLDALVAAALGGEDVWVMRNGHGVRLVPCVRKPRRKPGSAQGIITYMADDFDAPLEDFKEYTTGSE